MPAWLRDRSSARPDSTRMATALRFFRHAVWVCSALLLVFLSVCYWRRFDACTAVTVYPPWCWTVVGLTAVGIAYSRPHRRRTAILIVMWFVFLVVFADSPGSLIRAWLPVPQPAASFRVVSLNCASHIEAVQEAADQRPDVMLIQESSTRTKLEAIAAELFGPGNHVCWDYDASILTRGEVTRIDVSPEYRANFVHARVAVGDATVDVISLRLLPSAFRFDLWSPRCWQAFRENRERRRRQLAIVADYLQTIPADRPVLLGGDFNATPGDAVFRLLRPRLRDSFAAAGRGWGATFESDWPALRIDQIWFSRQLRPIVVLAQSSQYTDHRIVVADIAMNGP